MKTLLTIAAYALGVYALLATFAAYLFWRAGLHKLDYPHRNWTHPKCSTKPNTSADGKQS